LDDIIRPYTIARVEGGPEDKYVVADREKIKKLL
jgi:hypothetical protein